MDEFALIRRYFSRCGAPRSDVVLPVGDDAALLAPARDCELALTVDTLVEGRHFPARAIPVEDLGYRALAVNLSDLAAVGAEPAWALLALTLPEADPDWLERLARGFCALAQSTGVALVGGNVARGPLAVSVTLAGFVARGAALTRSGAAAGDALFVTGALGGGAAGLREVLGGARADSPRARGYLRPVPRLAAGRAFARRAHAAIDISDGLLGDLEKLLQASGGLGAELDAASVPLAPGAGLDDALGPSDDYELLIAAPPDAVPGPEALACPLTRIGRVTAGGGLRVDGALVSAAAHGYRHFQ